MATLQKTGVKLEPYQVIFKPLVTEKGHVSFRTLQFIYVCGQYGCHQKRYQGCRSKKLWNVRVLLKVRTQNRHGKPRRHKQVVGRTSDWKKAIVQLHDVIASNFILLGFEGGSIACLIFVASLLSSQLEKLVLQYGLTCERQESGDGNSTLQTDNTRPSRCDRQRLRRDYRSEKRDRKRH